MAVVEGLPLGDIAQKSLEDALRGERGGEREVAAGEPLGEAQKIGNDSFVLAGEHFSGAPEAGHHLVENQKHTRRIAFFPKFAQHSAWPEAHPGRSLDQGFDHHRRHIAIVETGERLEFGGRGNPGDGKLVARDGFVERTDAAEARRAERVAVVGAIKGHKPRPLGRALVLPELHRHFHRRLDGCGSVVAQKNAAQGVSRKKSAELRGELDGGGVGGSEKRNMGDAFELFAEGAGDRGMAMAVNIRPDRGIAVEVAAALAVFEHRALAAHEHERMVIRFAPIAHGREGMPEVRLVERLQLRRVPNISHRLGLCLIKRAA